MGWLYNKDNLINKVFNKGSCFIILILFFLVWGWFIVWLFVFIFWIRGGFISIGGFLCIVEFVCFIGLVCVGGFISFFFGKVLFNFLGIFILCLMVILFSIGGVFFWVRWV